MRLKMARALSVLIVVAAVTLVMGCDPGFTVRQITAKSYATHEASPALSDLRVEVKKYHVLAYVSYYNPQVALSNESSSTIKVRRMQLLTPRGSSAYEPNWTIDPGSVHTAWAHFELPHPLATMLKNGGDLRIDYESGGNMKSVTTRLSGKIEAINNN